jgi:hypothetical protein
MVSQLEPLPHIGALKLAPMAFASELARWLSAGRSPDNDMLAAILRNDLAAVVALSPQTAFDLPRATLHWLWNFAPHESFGSARAFDAWQQRGGLERRRRP